MNMSKVERGLNKDERDLARWGKKQQLRRNFGLLTMISLTCTLTITWEGSLVVFAGGLTNGGPAGVVYGFILVWFGSFLQTLVMGEMSSMMPLAGGQYYWVYILSPPKYAKFLSYITGWITVISWQSVIASTAFLGGTMIQGLLVLRYPDYDYQRWQGTLLFYAILLFALFINTILARILPLIESIVFVIHVVGFFGVLIPLVYFAPHDTALDVFTNFYNGGGWPSDGLSFFIGISSSIFAFIGLDAASHMAEEIQDASVVIPRTMILSVGINGMMGFAMAVAVLFCLGDQTAALESTTGFPYLWIFQNAIKSVGGTIAMASIVTLAMAFSGIAALATGSRMLWAFARDRGVPWSNQLSRVEPSSSLPMFSLGLSCLISVLLALLNIATTSAFNAFVSLVVAGFYASYLVAASCFLHKKLTSPIDEVLAGPFTLGRWSIPINIASILYTIIGLFFSFFPSTIDPTFDSMNWSILVFGVAMLFSLVYWAVYGRKIYTGPIVEVTLP